MSEAGAYALVAAVTALCGLAAIGLHYEGVSLLGRRLYGRPAKKMRRTVLWMVLGLLALHVTEIWIFGLGYWTLLKLDGPGEIAGTYSADLFDAFYLSASTFTTVGFGDLAPTGPIRLLAGTEGLIGLMLITWSASLTYIEMSRQWREDPPQN